MKKCKNCEHKNPDAAKFCNECGAKFENITISQAFEFADWDTSIQMYPGQIERFERALSDKMSPLSVDSEKQVGIFDGSGANPYETTLISCTCSDFIRRKLPCKHIYRLAVELGAIDISNFYNEKALEFKAKKFIDTLDKNSAIILSGYCCHNDYFHVMSKKELPDVIIQSGIFEEIDDDKYKLSYLKKSDLINLIDSSVKNLKNFKKADLIKYMLEHPSDKSNDYLKHTTILSVKNEYKTTLHSLQKYIQKLYPQY